MDSELKRTFILEHYQNPKNKGLIEDSKYVKVNMNNESCIDEVDIMLLYEDDKIKDIRFDGEACCISTSSTYIMIETLIGKTKEEAIEIIKNYNNMIEEKEYDKKILEDAIVYSDIATQPNRKKCALLSWWGVEKVLKELLK